MVLAQAEILRPPQVHIKGPGSEDGLDGFGLDDLISRHVAQRHDEKRNVEAVGENNFEELLRKYELYLKGKSSFIKDDIVLNEITEVLAPKEINNFLQMTIELENHKVYSYGTSDFITHLIQLSYEAGYNNFELNTTNLKIMHSLCCELKGGIGKVIYLQIDGNIGRGFGCKTTHSSFILRGDVENSFAYYAEYSSFTINGDFDIWGFGYNAAFCAFKTPNESTLNKLLIHVPKDRGHNIYFINPDGTEELMKRDI